jgi:fatty acid desaturase
MPCLASIIQLGATDTFQTVAYMTMYTLPVMFTFVLMPILDYLLGEEAAQALDDPTTPWQRISYRSVCIVFAAFQMIALASAAFVASRASTSWPMILVLALNCAVSGAYAFTVGHELIHSRSKLDKFAGQVLLTLNCYKHWGHSHMAHHAQVATDGDPASARYREAVSSSQAQHISSFLSCSCALIAWSTFAATTTTSLSVLFNESCSVLLHKQGAGICAIKCVLINVSMLLTVRQVIVPS